VAALSSFSLKKNKYIYIYIAVKCISDIKHTLVHCTVRICWCFIKG